MIRRTIPVLSLLLLLALAALACNFAAGLLNEPTAVVPTTPAIGQATITPQPEQPRPASPTLPATEAAAETALEATPEATLEPVAASGVQAEQLDSFQRLAAAEPPENDPLEVARLYGGWDGHLSQPPLAPETLTVNTVQPLRVLNHDEITYSTGQFVLREVSEHAYFWFSDQTPAGMLTPAVLEATGQAFDQIYEQDVAIFGSENTPGIDGDPRLHVVNATPSQLCNPPEACGLAGYFSGDDVIPVVVDPDSNAREMFVMNVAYFGTEFYLDVLAHEFRHMIEENYDRGDEAWEGEGSAMLAEDLLGFSGGGIDRANLFLAQPDQQLNSWTDDDTIPYYGMGYLINRYIYDLLGPELYRQFAASPATGLAAIDQVAADNGLVTPDGQAITGHQLWLDWLVAMALIGRDRVPDIYQFGVRGLDSPAMTSVRRLPAEFDTAVHQYAVDYYALSGSDELLIDFGGAPIVPLLDIRPHSGNGMWLADRANDSHARLTRTLDLTGVSEATLEYGVYHDIEAGYDFAYAFISEDGGQSFQPLVAEHMQGPSEDPSESALADHFYTGRSDGWRQERIDLSAYAGHEVQIRFAYLTDPVLTFGGIALDDIAVPEIGFFDDAETDAGGWTAEGFERVTGDIPQRWDLKLITFTGDGPRVESLSLSDDQSLAHRLDLFASDGRAILIVSAWAPSTLQPAEYRLAFRSP